MSPLSPTFRAASQIAAQQFKKHMERLIDWKYILKPQSQKLYGLSLEQNKQKQKMKEFPRKYPYLHLPQAPRCLLLVEPPPNP